MVETKPENLNASAEGDHDPHYEPIISLPLQETKSLEEDETELFKMRAKLYRWASECDPAEWKERGTGEVKLLQHKDTERVRVLMRRDKTLKICANHFVEEYMKLTTNCGSDRAWVWNVGADFSDEEPKKELLAMKFLNSDNANKFKEMFEKCIEINKNLPKIDSDEEDEQSTDEEESTEKDVDQAAEALESLRLEKNEKQNGGAEQEDVEESKPTKSQQEEESKEENGDSPAGSPEK